MNTSELPSFPTRRSSDLAADRRGRRRADLEGHAREWHGLLLGIEDDAADAGRGRGIVLDPEKKPVRSEEHTSELQSLRHLVCRLLLENKYQCVFRTRYTD